MVALLRTLDFWSSIIVRVIVVAGAIWVPLGNLIDTTIADVIKDELERPDTPLGTLNARTSPQEIASTIVGQINQQLTNPSTALGMANERALSAVPSESAIIMTNAECSLLGDDWILYSGAAGRFPVSAGEGADVNNNRREFEIGREDTDGEYTHMLLPEEMPRHAHVQPAPSTRCSGENCLDAGQDVRIGYVGGGRPHNNVPPYFVVNFCKKSLLQNPLER